MKNKSLLTAFLIICYHGLFAADDHLSISESRIPTAPAFSLLGINPTTVEHPASPMALGASLAGAIGDGSSGKFGNLALEFSPFWWTKESMRVSYDEFYYLHYDSGANAYRNKKLRDQDIFKNFYQTLTFSLATAQTEPLGETNRAKGNAVSLGFRSTLIKGRLPAKALESRVKLRSIDDEISNNMKLLPNGRMEVPDELYQQLLNAEEEYESRMQYLAGLQLEVGGGAVMDFVEGNLDDAEFRRVGGWINGSYRGQGEGTLMEQFALLANTRYFFTKTASGESVSSVDVGARISWISPSERLPLTLSAEYVRRFNSGRVEDVNRLGILATLKLGDRYSLYLSHGTNIEQEVLSEDENITFVGLNVLLEKATAFRDW